MTHLSIPSPWCMNSSLHRHIETAYEASCNHECPVDSCEANIKGFARNVTVHTSTVDRCSLRVVRCLCGQSRDGDVGIPTESGSTPSTKQASLHASFQLDCHLKPVKGLCFVSNTDSLVSGTRRIYAIRAIH